MVKWRRQIFPKNPRNINEFADQLTAPENSRLQRLFSANLTTEKIVDSNRDIHIAFYNKEMLERYSPSLTKLFVDGTFQIVPDIEGAYQLLSIKGVLFGHVSTFTLLKYWVS